MNPLYQSLNNDFISQFNQFKNTFQGDPKAQVQRLLATGQMSQEQFNRIAQMATQMRKMIK